MAVGQIVPFDLAVLGAIRSQIASGLGVLVTVGAALRMLE